jgi:two-component system sensor histidine kinase UhpB
MVNKAATKLLGYTKKTLLNKNKSAFFSIPKRTLQSMLKQQASSQKPVMLVLEVKRRGNPIPCEINFSVFKDANGNEQMIASLEDMSQIMQNQLNIDTKKDKIVSDNISLARLKQKDIDTENKQIVAKNIKLAKSKQAVIDSKNKETVARDIVMAKSKQKNLDTKNKKIVDDNIEEAKVKSDAEKLKYENIGRSKMLTEIEDHFRMIFHSSSNVLIDTDLITNQVLANAAFEQEFGYQGTNQMKTLDDWGTHIHPGDKEMLMKDFKRMLTSNEIEWKIAYRFMRADGSIANVLSSRIILRNADNSPYRMIGSLQDISKEKVLEERLQQEISLKEIQITEAAEDAKDTERSDIGKELHDNVNQLLGASRLYLEMAKRGGKDSEMYLSRSSEYTLTAIEEIRKLSKGLTTDIIHNLGLRVAIENCCRDIMEVTNVKIISEIQGSIETSVNNKFKLNIYRIIQEQLNNIVKHAHATNVEIRLQHDKINIKLSISDNGVGFDSSKNFKGIGVANIKSRVASYNGNTAFITGPGKGCILTATFSASDNLLKRALSKQHASR